MTLIAITLGSYPYGEATTNRHLSYLKGLIELGVNVKLLILQPAVNQSKKSNKEKGNFDGIEFEYMQWKVYKSISGKIINRFQAYLKTFQKIKYLLSKKNEDIRILILTTKSADIFPFILLSKLYQIPVFHERNEFPFLYSNSLLKKLSLWFYLKFLIPQFDGIFVITRALVEFFGKYNIKHDRIIHLPMTVEVERFSRTKERITEFGEYIAYCGSMYTEKDGVPDLIKAFNIVAKSDKNIKLLIIGDNSNKNKFASILDLINSSAFKDRIFCIGKIERDDMPKYLNSAKILALARPDNIQAKGGFPTKLGEYLSTGKPVVVTKVGEIPNYLTDRVNAFLAEPDNPLHFAKKLQEVISNYDSAQLIGQKGKEVAELVFSYKIQAPILLRFLQKSVTNINT